MKTARNNAHVSNACVSCRERKTKCDGEKPVCTSCKKKGRECTWLVDSDRRTARGRKCEECASWRAGYAELEARFAEKEARLAQTEARLAQILRETGLGSRALPTAQDSFATAELLPTALDLAAERRISFKEPLFPLHEATAGFPAHPEAFMNDHSADESDWLLASASSAFLDGTTELDALYGCPFAAAEPSGVPPEGYTEADAVSRDAKQ